MIRHIDEPRLESDLAYRFAYVTEFMGLDGKDLEAIHASAAHLAPVVPALVDAVYEKLAQYDATWRHFVPRQAGYEGNVPESVETLSMDHEQIQFRKAHLQRYLVRLVTGEYDRAMVGYLDLVGEMHTPGKGSAKINVPLVQMNALLGFVADALTATIFSLGLERGEETKMIRAFGKLLWVQNDLINRHYQSGPKSGQRQEAELATAN
jgi:hypothetical protein